MRTHGEKKKKVTKIVLRPERNIIIIIIGIHRQYPWLEREQVCRYVSSPWQPIPVVGFVHNVIRRIF